MFISSALLREQRSICSRKVEWVCVFACVNVIGAHYCEDLSADHYHGMAWHSSANKDTFKPLDGSSAAVTSFLRSSRFITLFFFFIQSETFN